MILLKNEIFKLISYIEIDIGSDLSGYTIISDCFPILKMFPKLNLIVKALNGITSVNNYLFLCKTKEFLRAIECINEEEISKRRDFFNKYTKENCDLLSITIISIIDKALSEYKAKVCGYIFKEYFYGRIDYEKALFCSETILALSSTYLEKLPNFVEIIDNNITSEFLNAIEAAGIVNSYNESGDDIIDSNSQNNSEKYKLTDEGSLISDAVKKAGKMIYI
mgnify:FL=1